MPKLPQLEVSGVGPNELRLLGPLLAKHRGRSVMPHVVANELGIHRAPALAIILSLGEENVLRPRYAVYHRCSVAPVEYRDYETGFQPTPWTCPECDEEVLAQGELSYDLVALVPGDFELEPER